jgi:AraC-like DNA-binding protein/mannose-6-phosphate isomerase-like protein (cupin superfamily)
MASYSLAEKPSETKIQWENVHSVVEPQTSADGMHVWSFPPSFPVDVKFFDFGRKRSIRLRRHDYFELVYVYSGNGTYQVQDREFTIGEGDLIVLNGFFYHRLSEVRTQPFRAVVLYFQPGVLSATDSTGGQAQYLMPFLLQDESFPHVVSRNLRLPTKVFDLVMHIQKELPATTDRARLVARTYLQMILVMLINHYKGQFATAGAFERRQLTLERLRPLFDYIDVHYPEPIPLSCATKIVGMSKPHFMRCFKKATGQSFDTYLNRFRITKAQALLASTDLPITRVGQDVGFSDQSYFGLVFRRLLQITPRDYRKQAQLGEDCVAAQHFGLAVNPPDERARP